MSSEDQLKKAVHLLKAAADPELIILFGSRARGENHASSDYDIMVVEKEVSNKRAETVRLLRILGSTLVNIDLIVVSEKKFKDWRDTLNSVYYKASKEGRILYDKAA